LSADNSYSKYGVDWWRMQSEGVGGLVFLVLLVLVVMVGGARASDKAEKCSKFIWRGEKFLVLALDIRFLSIRQC
jgi:hypothetical protein